MTFIKVSNPFAFLPSNSNMPGVIFIICIPSSNYEHILKFGKSKELIPIEGPEYNPIRLAVELRDKKSRSTSIPVHFTQSYYNAVFNPQMENITEDNEFFTMESVSINTYLYEI